MSQINRTELIRRKIRNVPFRIIAAIPAMLSRYQVKLLRAFVFRSVHEFAEDRNRIDLNFPRCHTRAIIAGGVGHPLSYPLKFLFTSYSQSVAIFAVFLGVASHAQIISFTEVAGNGVGYADGVAAESKFSSPQIEPTDDGTIWVLDVGNQRIRKISNDRMVSTVLQFTPQLAGPPAPRKAPFHRFSTTYSKKLGFLWSEPGLIHQAKDGADRILAGTPGRFGNSSLLFGKVLSLASDFDGDILIADAEYDMIRKLTTDATGQNPQTERKVGGNAIGHVDGIGISALLNWPNYIDVGDGCYWVHEPLNNCIRKVDTNWFVTTPTHLNPRSGAAFNLGGGAMLVNRIESTQTNSTSFFSIRYPNGAEVAARFKDGSIARTSFVYGFRKSSAGLFCVSAEDAKIYRVEITHESANPTVSASQFCGVTITGDIGRTYRVEFADTAEGPWNDVAIVSLEKSPQTWFDESAPANEKRFYRAVLLP